ncbi:MAG TPA: type III-B CRISPR module RAMP protein Cmr4, partial [Campylobacterales bacterium]|nr:type III-B CRISPR module RAMP protein Cmr4 [Campylobacterales bacterium]
NDEIKEKLIILSDDDFKDFVTLSTEVITRTKIDNATGTVKDGALFTEEYLPSETVMYSLALASPIVTKVTQIQNLNNEEDVMNFFISTVPEVMQIGGNATIGKGIVSIVTGGNHAN